MKTTTIIVAGGKGLRMKSDIPKQFLPYKGFPVLMHTINKFVKFDPAIQIIIVLPEDQIQYWEELCEIHCFTIEHQKIAGGKTRFESVKNGLSLAPDEGLIGIHDGVRPFILPDVIKRIFDAAEDKGNATPAITPAESVRYQSAEGNEILNRDDVRLIQTPQVFKADLLKTAYMQDYQLSFTDDASVFEAAGHKINIVEGQKGNIKITVAGDLQ